MAMLEDIFAQEAVQELGWTLVHFVWQGTVVALFLAILLRVLRKSAANLRYIICCLALGVIVLLPVVTIKLISVSIPTTASVEGAAVDLPMNENREVPVMEMPAADKPARVGSVSAVPAISWKEVSVELLEMALPYIVLGWLAGVLGLSVWHLGGWTQLQRLRRRMVKEVDASLHKKLTELSQLLDVRQAVQIMESALVQVPTVVGWLRPVILLPASALSGLSCEQLEAILAHELAHILRLDYLVNMLQTVVEILGFYHPAVWWVSHKIRVERENCCDDLAVSVSGNRVRYARALTLIEETRAGQPGLAVAASGGSLFSRICRLVGKDHINKEKAGWVPSVIAIVLSMSFLISISFAMNSQAKEVSGVSGPYEITFAEDWKPYISGGKLKIIGEPFYGVCSEFFAATPHVQIQWSVKNLTSKPIVLQVQYKCTRATRRGMKTGNGVAYELGPEEERIIDEIVPMASAKDVEILYIMAEALFDSEYNITLSSRHEIVTTGAFQIPSLPANELIAKDEENANFRVKQVRLEHSQEEGNVLEVELVNQTKQELPVVLYAAAGFPKKGWVRTRDVSFKETTTRINSNSTSVIRLSYSVPETGREPYLVFTLWKPAERWFTVEDELGDKRGLPYTPMAAVLKQGYLNPICWGWFNLSEAAGKQLAILPRFVPVEERAKLTAQKRSEHFLFRYRPDSYAERHVDTAIKEREEAYKELSTFLKMELPETVTIDLYPDMEAKGLGSGTTWTPANTVTDKQIAEVYNESYQADAYHELAHIFAYNFGNVSVSGGEPFVEAFAVYFEAHNINHNIARKSLSRKLNEGKLTSLSEILLLVHGSEENIILIDFLLKKDLERFKSFYNRVVCSKDSDDLEKACQEVYQTDLKGLEEQWHEFIKGNEGGLAESLEKEAASAEQRVKSARMLKRLGLLLVMYAADHQGEFPDDLFELGPYATEEDAAELGPTVEEDTKYVGEGKTSKDSPQTVVIAYDKSLLQEGNGTNVLFADGHVEFTRSTELGKLGIIAQSSNLEVMDVKIDPIRQGKNVVHVEVKNNSEEDQMFRIQMYTRSPDVGGWGTSFFDTIKAGETKWTRHSCKIRGPIADGTYIRLDFHNPGPTASFDMEKWSQKIGRTDWFKRVKYFASDLEHYKADKSQIKAASKDEADAVIKTLRQIQDHIKNKEYESAWSLFTQDFRDTEFAFRYDAFERFKQMMESPQRYVLSGMELLALEPKSVNRQNDVFVLDAAMQDKLWTVDFVQAGEQYKLDSISGLISNDWQERLLPLLETRTTKHFDIYYFKDSTAEREIEQIVNEKEKGFAEICQFLGRDSDVRIRMIFFEDGETKRYATAHQGAGWAFGNTIVEVYNEEEKLDPYHETVHILMGPYGGPPAMFTEGFATYMSERLGAHGLENLGGGEASLYGRVRELKEKDEWIELEELVTYTDIGPEWSRPPISYAEAGAFVKFLIDSYGKDKFLRAYKTLKNSDEKAEQQQNVKELEQIYGKSLQELEKQWEKAFSS
ncbi:MAG: M56 family metallopeptidase [Planctomycetota bacterium]|jgi:prepilin-type processing-associated H-X9-DG protein